MSHSSDHARVFLNGRFLSQRVTGVQRYARETLACLDELIGREAGDERWTLLLPRGAERPALSHIGSAVVGRLHGHAWEQIELPWHARGGLLVGFGLSGPLVSRRQIITVHDANVVRMPEAFGWRFRAWYRVLAPRVVGRAERIVAVSRFSAAEAVECYRAPPARVRLSTEGWQHLERVSADDRILDRYALRDQPFALAVSSPTPNKNFEAIARAVALLGEAAPRCVVAGGVDHAVFRSGTGLRALQPLGYISDRELKALYQHAACFIFPSYYEGFGIPALEAMACGCPVLASTAPAVREVCGDAALYFNPRWPAELAGRMAELFRDSSLAARMSATGLERARRYSWMESARMNLEVIREALHAIKPSPAAAGAVA